eukprot:CAMPEP_0167797760 /NCGR_PEP_ID=MMETSP0111_2-20121227/15865_1 /TAXON_ID=91324 /ORGANISM="Lotharella globosa, Strain CCCM811" /LENGTH=78 /DNA_ID=CAMNT_0007691965 /DNA_START=66 /DNA_END=299 /DNA_ORIENTATION=+
MAYGFHQYGVQMNGTGGCYIHHSWMGEEAPFTPKSSAGAPNLTSSVISLEGSEHDCYVQVISNCNEDNDNALLVLPQE